MNWKDLKSLHVCQMSTISQKNNYNKKMKENSSKSR